MTRGPENKRTSRPTHPPIPAADKLKVFFDPASMNGSSTQSRQRKASYNPMSSWDALSQTSAPFARIQQCYTINKPTRQIGIVGPQVIEMNDTPPGGIFAGGVDQHRTRPFPPTIEQVDSQEANQHPPQQGEIAVVQDPKFQNMFVTKTQIIKVKVPEFLEKAGDQANGMLLLPEERRQIMTLERDRHKAERIRRKALNDKGRLQNLMKVAHPAGVLGVDSTANSASEVYGEVAQAIVRKAESAKEHQQRRHDFLAYRQQQPQRLGFDFLQHCEAGQAGPEPKDRAVYKQFASKKRAGPSLNTQDRIFDNRPLKTNPLRTQNIFDQNNGGKHYDIVQHTVYNHWKPMFVDAKQREHKNLLHPSQASAERGRNLQGYMAPSHRCTSPTLDPQY